MTIDPYVEFWLSSDFLRRPLTPLFKSGDIVSIVALRARDLDPCMGSFVGRSLQRAR